MSESATQTDEDLNRRANEPTRPTDSRPPTPAASCLPSPPTSEEDLQMRGMEGGPPDGFSERDRTPSPIHSMLGTTTPPAEALDLPDPTRKLVLKIRELRELANIRNEHKGIKQVAAQLAEILLNIQNPGSRINLPSNERVASAPSTLKALRRHEYIMAKLLKESSSLDEVQLGAV